MQMVENTAGGGSSSSSSTQISRRASGSNTAVLKTTRGSFAEVNLAGAQVTSWKHDSRGQELIFTSIKAGVEHGKVVRGGIRICFPKITSPIQIDDHGPGRNMVWCVDSDPPPLPNNNTRDQNAVVDLILESMEGWNNSCEFRLRVTLGDNGDLMMTSRIKNTNADGRPFKFAFAYQNHIRVDDITDVRIEGLETLDYIDRSGEAEKRKTEQDDSVTFESEVDRIYLSTPTKIATIDHGGRFTIVLRKDRGLPDAIVWNPMDKMVKVIPGIGSKDHCNLVVVGAAAVEKQITLKPGEEWKCSQILSYSPTSYNSDEHDD